MEEIKKIEVSGQQYGVADMLMRSVMGGNAQVIEWSHTHNMNDYKDAGAYRIKGERTGNPLDDNLPIMNQGSGHTIEGILYVLDSSLANGSGKQDDCTITQFLMLSNRVGGQEGDMYMRSAYGANKDSLTWKPWEKYQTNMEVGVVTDAHTLNPANPSQVIAGKGMNSFIDNGIYSGIYINEGAETFAMLVINDYMVASLSEVMPSVAQIKFSILENDEVKMQYRVASKDENSSDYLWGDWISLSSSSGGFPENWSVGVGRIVIGTSGGSGNGDGATINAGVTIGTGATIAKNIWIGNGAVDNVTNLILGGDSPYMSSDDDISLGGKTKIGAGVLINNDIKIIHHNNESTISIGTSVYTPENALIGRNVRIGEYVCIGTTNNFKPGAFMVYAEGDKVIFKYNDKTAELPLT